MKQLIFKTTIIMTLAVGIFFSNSAAALTWTVTCTGVDDNHNVWWWQGQTESYMASYRMARHCESQGGTFLQSTGGIE